MVGFVAPALEPSLLQSIITFDLEEYNTSGAPGFHVVDHVEIHRPTRCITWKYSSFRFCGLADRLALGELRGDPLYATANQLRALDRTVLLSDADPTAVIVWLRLLARAQQLGVPCRVTWGGMNDAWINALILCCYGGQGTTENLLIEFDDIESSAAALLFKHVPDFMLSLLGDNVVNIWRAGMRYELESVTVATVSSSEGSLLADWLVRQFENGL